MARAQYQVLVIPYYMENDSVQYCIFERRDMGIWQFIAGGGEDEDAIILASAQREAEGRLLCHTGICFCSKSERTKDRTI